MSLLPHSFGTPICRYVCRYVLCLTSFTLRLSFLTITERQLIVCDDDTGPSHPQKLFKTFKERIDHVYCSSEGTHVILLIFPGFAVKDQPYM